MYHVRTYESNLWNYVESNRYNRYQLQYDCS